MTFLKTGTNGVSEVSIPAYMLGKGIIIVNGEITSQVANQFIEQMLIITSEPFTTLKQVKVLINSSGGSVDAGMLMVDAIQNSNLPVWTYCLEKAYSMGALLTIAGSQSFILQNSKLMLHKPWISNVKGNSTELESYVTTLKQYEQTLIQLIYQKTQKPKKSIEKIIQDDHYFTAQESVDYGLIDEIVPFSHIMGKGEYL